MSNISKNIDSLLIYNNYKNFLDLLSAGHASKEEKELMDQKAANKKADQDKKRTKEK